MRIISKNLMGHSILNPTHTVSYVPFFFYLRETKTKKAKSKTAQLFLP